MILPAPHLKSISNFKVISDFSLRDMIEVEKKIALIVAGGVGSRAGGNLPKQFQLIGDKPMIIHTLEAFLHYDANMAVIIVIHPDYIDDLNSLLKIYHIIGNLSICSGGDNRCESVSNGLDCASDRVSDSFRALVAIHDAARPVVSTEMIDRGFKAVKRAAGAIPAVECVNSLRRLTGACRDEYPESVSVSRKDYVEVQTPQVFYLDDIMNAYALISQSGDFSGFTDDASVAEAAGMSIKLYQGDTSNLKVTYPIDFKIAELLLEGKE